MGCSASAGRVEKIYPKDNRYEGPIVLEKSVFKYELKGEWTQEGWDEWKNIKQMVEKHYPLTIEGLPAMRKVMSDGVA